MIVTFKQKKKWKWELSWIKSKSCLFFNNIKIKFRIGVLQFAHSSSPSHSSIMRKAGMHFSYSELQVKAGSFDWLFALESWDSYVAIVVRTHFTVNARNVIPSKVRKVWEWMHFFRYLDNPRSDCNFRQGCIQALNDIIRSPVFSFLPFLDIVLFYEDCLKQVLLTRQQKCLHQSSLK